MAMPPVSRVKHNQRADALVGYCTVCMDNVVITHKCPHGHLFCYNHHHVTDNICPVCQQSVTFVQVCNPTSDLVTVKTCKHKCGFKLLQPRYIGIHRAVKISSDRLEDHDKECPNRRFRVCKIRASCIEKHLDGACSDPGCAAIRQYVREKVSDATDAANMAAMDDDNISRIEQLQDELAEYKELLSKMETKVINLLKSGNGSSRNAALRAQARW